MKLSPSRSAVRGEYSRRDVQGALQTVTPDGEQATVIATRNVLSSLSAVQDRRGGETLRSGGVRVYCQASVIGVALQLFATQGRPNASSTVRNTL